MEDLCVSHNYTQRDLLLLYRRRRRRRRPPPFIHVYTLFFRIEKNHPEIVFFYQRLCKQGSNLPFDFQKYHSENADTLGVLHNLYIYIYTLYENKKGQITRASSSNHAKYRTRVVSFLWLQDAYYLIWERSSHRRKITRPTGVRVHYEFRRAPMAQEFVLKTSVWVRVYS